MPFAYTRQMASHLLVEYVQEYVPVATCYSLYLIFGMDDLVISPGHAPKFTTSRSNAISGVRRLRFRAASVAISCRYAPSSWVILKLPTWRIAFSTIKGAIPNVAAICPLLTPF